MDTCHIVFDQRKTKLLSKSYQPRPLRYWYLSLNYLYTDSDSSSSLSYKPGFFAFFLSSLLTLCHCVLAPAVLGPCTITARRGGGFAAAGGAGTGCPWSMHQPCAGAAAGGSGPDPDGVQHDQHQWRLGFLLHAHAVHIVQCGPKRVSMALVSRLGGVQAGPALCLPVPHAG